jgi:hypothetical protein
MHAAAAGRADENSDHVSFVPLQRIRAQIGIGTNDAHSSDLQAVRVQVSVASGLLARAAFKQVRKRA